MIYLAHKSTGREGRERAPARWRSGRRPVGLWTMIMNKTGTRIHRKFRYADRPRPGIRRPLPELLGGVGAAPLRADAEPGGPKPNEARNW